jgi:hypothetical protein
MDSIDKINYIGNKPLLTDFKKIKKDEYDNIPLIWNAKEETIKYLSRDVDILHEVLYKFEEFL